MYLRKLLAAAVATSAMVAAPAMANPAAPLSISKVAGAKASTSSKKGSKLATGAGIAIGLVVVGATVAIVAASDSK